MTTVNAYNNPESYSQNNDLQYQFAMSVIKQVNINSTDRILDLGCGDGKITFEIAKLARKGCVLGTDISSSMVEFASKKYSTQDNLKFVSMDTGKNIFKNQFDLITSFNSLHWVQNQEQALKGIYNAATENARIVLLLSHKKSLYHEVIDNLCNSHKWSSFFKEYASPRLFIEKEKYKELLLESGLEVISLNEKTITYNFNSIKDFSAFLKASMAHIKRIPNILQEDFIDDYIIEFFKLSKCRDIYHIPVDFWCLEAIASKLLLKNENQLEEKPSHTLSIT